MTARRALAGLILSGWILCFPGARQAAAQSPGFVATVKSRTAELRKGASASSPVVATVKSGDKFAAYGLSQNKQWLKVRGSGGSAWISVRSVSVARGSVPPPRGPGSPPGKLERASNGGGPAPSRGPGPGGPKKWATVTARKTDVRLNPTGSAPTVAVAQRNDLFEFGGFSNDKDWVKVRGEDGRTGWILKAHVRPGRPGQMAGPRREGRRPDPPRPPRRRPRGDDTRMWADGGVVLFRELVTSREGNGYDLSGMGFGGGVRFERRLNDMLMLEGGYLGTANQRIRAPQTDTTVFSTLHRIDVSARYDHHFGGNPDGHKVFGLGGYQNYSFLVQPQNLTWFYSQIYHSLAVGAGGEASFAGGTLRMGADARYFGPVLAGQIYGNGGKGGDGQANTSTGYAAGLWLRKEFSAGSMLGLEYRGHFYRTSYQGEGIRGPHRIHKVKVEDDFNALTLTYFRGF